MIQWLIKNREILNPKIEKLKWTKEYGIKEANFSIRITLNKKIFEGNGSDLNDDFALTIAIIEAIERFLLFQLGVSNSNGVALHVNRKKAIENARNELIEQRIVFYEEIMKFYSFFLAYFVNLVANKVIFLTNLRSG